MRFKNILMDFDGTIARTGDGIVNGVKYACETMGCTEGSPWEDWRRYIGPTVYRFTTEILGLDEAGRERFMGLYSKYYKERGVYEGPLYEGMGELISELRSRGAGVYVASSKPLELMNACVEYLGLEFDGVTAMIPGRVSKDEVVRYTMREYSLERAESVMVGDRDGDVLAGKKYCAAAVGVSYGYGTEEELAGAGADFVARGVAQLREYLLG